MRQPGAETRTQRRGGGLVALCREEMNQREQRDELHAHSRSRISLCLSPRAHCNPPFSARAHGARSAAPPCAALRCRRTRSRFRTSSSVAALITARVGGAQSGVDDCHRRDSRSECARGATVKHIVSAPPAGGTSLCACVIFCCS